MITPEQHAEIRRLYFGEHWKVGTIVTNLGVHPDTVRAAIALDTRVVRRGACRRSILDPYLPFIRDTLAQYPRLRATRLYEMLRPRGYGGSANQLRRLVRVLRPQVHVALYRRLVVLPAEEAQIDWGAFGSIRIGHGTRALSGFVMVLSYSRALFAHFTVDQTLESFLRGHVEAFQVFGGSARTLVYDNLKSAVLERQGTAIRFHPRLLELAGHYHFAPRPCTPARGNEKGKVERQIRYLRDAFFAARTFRDVDDLNAQFQRGRDEVAPQRLHPEQRDQTVAQVFTQEQARLLPLPAHPFETDLMRSVVSGKLAYVRFDRNSYSIPHTHVRRPLTLLASATTVRVVDGAEEIARHGRSYDSGTTIEDPTHLDRLLTATQQANASSTRDRLRLAVPITATLFARARWSPTVLLDTLVQAELEARARRRLERQLQAARLGRFKPLADFEWTWPTLLHRPTVDRVFSLDFLAKGENVVLVAAQGLGKTMLTKNLLHQAVLAGHSALFITASDLLLDLNGQDTSRALERRLRADARPQILAIDEIGYLSYDAHAADLLFQVISRRYEQRSIVVTTNLLFKQWDTVFPNASCAVALIDRLTHHAEIIPIEGESYRKREAELTQKKRRVAP